MDTMVLAKHFANVLCSTVWKSFSNLMYMCADRLECVLLLACALKTPFFSKALDGGDTGIVLKG